MMDNDHITRLLRSLDLLPDSNMVIQGGSGPKYAGLTVGQLKWLLHEWLLHEHQAADTDGRLLAGVAVKERQ